MKAIVIMMISAAIMGCASYSTKGSSCGCGKTAATGEAATCQHTKEGQTCSECKGKEGATEHTCGHKH